jgi:branched-chain amino acid transport system permease protein
MDVITLLIQLLNGVQYGLLLFLIASGLTLVFGVMGIINLAHGSMYMIGAYLAWVLFEALGSLSLAIAVALPSMLLLGLLIERFLVATLYRRDHLYQVLLTYGLILVLNGAQSILWGNDVHSVPVPAIYDWSIPLTDTLGYPVYRLVVSALCLGIAIALWFVVQKTRLGMLIRAGASDREMLAALGIDVGCLFAVVFAAGVVLAGFAGMLAAPLSSVYPGMGEQVLIICFVVVVLGGVGSIKGAFFGALLIGVASTLGSVLLPQLASVIVYLLMAVVLLLKPRGLFT